MKQSDLVGMLQCPVNGRPLKWTGKVFLEEESGRQYKEVDGVIDLVAKEEKNLDLGDAGHYDHHPFEFFDWTPEQLSGSAIEEELKEFLRKIPDNAVICDVGCGAGRVSAFLEYQGFTRALAFDYSARSLAIVRKHTQLPVIRANNLCLPLKSTSVDVLISTGVIHHTPNPLKALRENCRVLRSGGWMYLKVYRYGSYYHFIHLFIGGFMRFLANRGKVGKALVEKAFFELYKILSRIIKPGRTKKDAHLRALFHDYFLNPQTRFVRPGIIAKVLYSENMRFVLKKTRRPTNLYLIQKCTSFANL